MASMREPLKLPPHRSLRLQWAQNYMTLDLSCVLITKETRVILDETNGWANGWVYFRDERHQLLRRQQQGGGVILWAGIIGDRLVGPFRVPEEVKVIAAAFCNLLKEVLDLWLDDILLSLLRNLEFMHDNTPSHSTRTTQIFLGFYGIQCERLMV
ncbi:uncharacterized protein LOC118762690 [Octopus sinensis]|uniref:Uncharacterized protein LOC118762690 n=1 Tax=Octopus sinensis TaxID=2607531 RepID=A0A7E6EPH6_9MOLL|nr:uncharacterized protein LOC118762690 [Octopus sinensis]